MKQIKLSQGKVAFVDDEDYEYLNQFRWYACKAHLRDAYYVSRSERIEGKRKTIKMHREIMNAPKGMDVDHKDGDGLNNQRSNLRVCTRSQNIINSKKVIGTTSKYIGVSWSVSHNRWRVYLRVNNKQKFLGQFKTELEAGIIYNIVARRYYGEFVRPNKLTKVSYNQTLTRDTQQR